jgi:hypothetical protein
MRKLTVLAMLAAVLIAGSAFAVNRTPVPNATFAFGTGGAAIGPTTTNNDDSCDIGVAPAATLLLPYFEVDFRSTQATAHTTLFTITNVSAFPQIAHVVVWTDWSYAALDFNIYLTGFDVQSINLYDLFSRGVIAPPSGTSSNTTIPTGNPADAQPQFQAPLGNPNFTSVGNCNALPGPLPPSIVADLQSVFTAGTSTGAICSSTSTRVGGTHTNAIGYITVDVVANCSTSLVANDPAYFAGTILFDNVLIGDYQDINPNPATGNFAGGNPMVHIRAVPEGGAAVSDPGTNLPYTFYDRYTALIAGGNRHRDRRQPLPALFAARYIQGGTGGFNTNYKIWREGVQTICPTGAATAPTNNSAIAVAEIVRFDEHENASITSGGIIFSPPPAAFGLPETSSQPLSGAVFPAIPTAAGDVAGWTYLNLNNPGGGGAPQPTRTVGLGGVFTAAQIAAGVTTATTRASQNWVIVSMAAEGRFQVDFDAAWLGNGCSAIVPATTGLIGPAGGVFVCPAPFAPGAGCPLTPVGTNTTPI